MKIKGDKKEPVKKEGVESLHTSVLFEIHPFPAHDTHLYSWFIEADEAYGLWWCHLDWPSDVLSAVVTNGPNGLGHSIFFFLNPSLFGMLAPQKTGPQNVYFWGSPGKHFSCPKSSCFIPERQLSSSQMRFRLWKSLTMNDISIERCNAVWNVIFGTTWFCPGACDILDTTISRTRSLTSVETYRKMQKPRRQTRVTKQSTKASSELVNNECVSYLTFSYLLQKMLLGW